MLSLLYGPSHPYMTIGKTIALTRQTFVGKTMSLLYNMLSRLAVALSQFLIPWASTDYSLLVKKNKRMIFEIKASLLF